MNDDEIDALLSAVASPEPATNEERAWQAVKEALSNLSGGSGHLASYFVSSDTFALTLVFRDENAVGFSWTATGHLLTEFEHDEDLPPEELAGTVDLHGERVDVTWCRV